MTEIDRNGQLVQLDRFSPPPSPPDHTHPLPSHTPHSLSVDDELIIEEPCAAAGSLSSDMTRSGPDLSEGPLLNELITEDQSAAALVSTPAAGSLSSSEGEKMVKSRPDVSSVPPLNELITEEQYKALSDMAEKMKMTLDPQLGESVCLGEIEKIMK